MKVTKLLHTRMRVSDIDQTIRFYQNVLGLEVMDRKVSPRGSHLAFLKVPNSDELIELCSFPASGPVTVQEDLVHLAFEVENLDETIRAWSPRASGLPTVPRLRHPAAVFSLSTHRTVMKWSSSSARRVPRLSSGRRSSPVKRRSSFQTARTPQPALAPPMDGILHPH